MIHLLIAFAGTLAIAVGTELLDFEARPRPLLWVMLMAAYPWVDGLAIRCRWRFQGWLRLAIFLLVDAAVTYPLGYAAWSLHDLGWMGRPLPSLGLLLLPAASCALWASPWIHRRAQDAGARLEGSSEDYCQWLGYHARILVVPAALLGLFVGIADWIESSAFFERGRMLHPGAPVALCAIAFLLLLAASPLLIRILLPTRPFPQGKLREAMERAAIVARTGRLAIRVSGKRTRHVVNACAFGVCPGTRGVIFTSGILRLLGPDQLFAVFCHELAHLSRHHISSFAGLGVVFLLSVPPLGAATGDLPRSVSLGIIGTYGLVYWIFLFGAVSRRLETEADLVAAKAVGPGVYASALREIADLTGPSAKLKSWRHLSIQERLEILAQAETDPRIFEHVQKQGRGLRRYLGGLVALSATLFLAFPAFIARPETSRDDLAHEAVSIIERYAPVAACATRRVKIHSSLQWFARDPQAILTDWKDLLQQARNTVQQRDAFVPADSIELSTRLEDAERKVQHSVRGPQESG